MSRILSIRGSTGDAVRAAGVLAATLAPLAPAVAQDSAAVRITAVRVTVTREAARSRLELPFAVTRLTIDTARAATRRASLTEMLLFVPGVSISNRFNPTQDPRLAVRGFGARSAFGIRGVRVLRDGIPLTLADGQTAVDFLDVETVDAAEVFRGSAGALYGNSAGGVVDFRTQTPPDSGARGRIRSFYADGITRLSANGGARLGALGVQGTFTRNEGDGPRDYSRFRNSSALGDVRWTMGGTQFQTQVSWYDSPLAENPGALTDSIMRANPTMADSNNVRRRASKTVNQKIFALQATRVGERASFDANVQLGKRSLENPQTFAIVAFDRDTYGGSLRGQYGFGSLMRPVRITAGVDLLSQSDDRQNFTNCVGLVPRPASCPGTVVRGGVTLDQRERVRGLGAYARAEITPAERLSLTATLRSDRTRFAVLDHRATTPVEESRTLSAVTPMIGVNWRVGPISSLYANISSSFETPTSTELANQPDGSTGLNRELKPQHGRTYELGSKGAWGSYVSYDASVFRVDTKDELIPFEIPNGGGRRFFRNAGKTLRHGAELSMAMNRESTTLGVAATWLRYTYEEFTVAGTSFAGKRVPGVAPHTVSAFANVRPRWGLVALEVQHVARTPADDANQNHADAFALVHARLAIDALSRFGIRPSVGIDNLLDETYAGNIVANAAFGRFYEPGLGRTLWMGVHISAAR